MENIGDNVSKRKFLDFFTGLTVLPANTYRFFERSGDTYSAHGLKCAEYISMLAFKSLKSMKTMTLDDRKKPDDCFHFVLLNRKTFEKVCRILLLIKGYRIEVYAMKTKNNWSLEYSASPGNLVQFEEMLFGCKDEFIGIGMMSVRFKRSGSENCLGIALINNSTYTFKVAEIFDDDFFSKFESILVYLSPKECLLPSITGEFYSKIHTVLNRNGILVTVAEKNLITKNWLSDLHQDLNRIIKFHYGQKEDANTLQEIKMELAMQALGSGIKYMKLSQDDDNNSNFKIETMEFDNLMYLDAAALSSLNVFSPSNILNKKSNKFNSIFGVLNNCRTSQGQRLLQQWVKQPLTDINSITVRHDIVESLLCNEDILKELHKNLLKKIPDVLGLLKKIIRKSNKFNLQDLFKIYQSILNTKKIYDSLNKISNDTVQTVLCNSLNTVLLDLTKLREMVEEILDFSALARHEYLIKESYNENLKALNTKMALILAKLNKLHDHVAVDLKLEKSNIKLEYVSQFGYHFRITLKNDSFLRKSKNYTTLSVVKGGVRFTCPDLTKYNNKFKENREMYKVQQNYIIDEVKSIALTFQEPLSTLNYLIAQIDCLVSFAIAAENAPQAYVRPQMIENQEERQLYLEGLRHPCIELQDNMSYISNDAIFKNNDAHMLIITGPNMGGKSTYIKSVGIAVLMAQIGSFVPCSKAKLSIVDSIFCRVGASDDLCKGLSTFMVEMIESASIVRGASRNSLVIIDELGRGTSTYEGGGIAWSIAEHLAKTTNCFSLFATHFFEITSISESVSTVKNFHVAAAVHSDHFTLLYKLQPGAMEQSYGIHVAKLVKFPPSVIEIADKIYKEFDNNVTTTNEEDKKCLNKIYDQIETLLNEQTYSPNIVSTYIQTINNLVKCSNIKKH